MSVQSMVILGLHDAQRDGLDELTTSMLITQLVEEYFRRIVVTRANRYRDMTPDQQYFLAHHVVCPSCEATVDADCINLRAPGNTNEHPHPPRLALGYQQTHPYQLLGLGYPPFASE